MSIEKGLILLLVLLVAAILIAVFFHKKNKHNTPKGYRVHSSKAKYKDITYEPDTYRSKNDSKNEQLEAKYNKLKYDYKKLQRDYEKLQEDNKNLQYNKEKLDSQCFVLEGEKSKLEKKLEELTRENNELKMLAGKEPNPVDASPIEDEQSPTDKPGNENADSNEPKPDNPSNGNAIPLIEEKPTKALPKEVTMYASFPRSADNCIYFSDLTEIIGDDSYFELKISKDKNTATFRPLDFMKIRNYDAAMIAILTDGAKPNAASSVIGIENGKVHKEGSDWIIDTPAKIKLA